MGSQERFIFPRLCGPCLAFEKHTLNDDVIGRLSVSLPQSLQSGVQLADDTTRPSNRRHRTSEQHDNTVAYACFSEVVADMCTLISAHINRRSCICDVPATREGLSNHAPCPCCVYICIQSPPTVGGISGQKFIRLNLMEK